MTYGLEHGVPEDSVMGVLGAIFYMLRRAQGRIDELVRRSRTWSRPNPAPRVAGRPRRHAQRVRPTRRSRRARGVPRRQRVRQGPVRRRVPRDPLRSRPAHPHRAARRADDAARLRPPPALRRHVNWSGTSITDANDHGLALLAARLGDHEQPTGTSRRPSISANGPVPDAWPPLANSTGLACSPSETTPAPNPSPAEPSRSPRNWA